MVSTRSSSGITLRPRKFSDSPPPPPPSTNSNASRTRRGGSATASSSSSSAPGTLSSSGWSHAPGVATLAWLAVSLPLVAWDTGYVLLRPRTMPGGSLHWPLWVPYALYGEVDHVYGFKQWNAGNGFTAAQGALNLVETLLYGVYLWLWWTRGQPAAARRRAGSDSAPAVKKVLVGRPAALAVLIAFSASVMTLSKTVLYWLNEYYSNFDNIGHNDWFRLVFLWIIPNGAWLVFPTIMIISFGSEILDGLTAGSATISVKKE